MIYNHGKEYIEFNAGSRYTLAATAMAFAMGIDIPNVVREPHEIGWADEETKKGFSNIVFPFLARQTVLPYWGRRYNQTRLLIKSIAEDKLLLQEQRNGSFIDKVPKSPFKVTFGLFLLGGLFFSLIVGPLFGAVKSPIDNLHNLNIYVADFDGGVVGSSFISFMKKVQANANFPHLDFSYSSSSTSPDDLRNKVHSLNVLNSFSILIFCGFEIGKNKVMQNYCKHSFE